MIRENNNMGIESSSKAVEMFLKNRIIIDSILACLNENLGKLYEKIGNFKEVIK